MLRNQYAMPIRKRPRPKMHKFRAIVVEMNSDVCDDCGHICNACMEAYAAEAKYNRPDHVWRVEDGKVKYMEDDIYELHLGRKLRPTESIVHRNGDPKDNRLENLELVIIPDMEVK
jgi:hypothetical protein